MCPIQEIQLDHLIDVTLDAGGHPDHAARRVADLYPTDNVQDYINMTEMDLSAMTLTKSNNTDALTLPSALKRRILSTKGFWQNWGTTLQGIGLSLVWMTLKSIWLPILDPMHCCKLRLYQQQQWMSWLSPMPYPLLCLQNLLQAMLIFLKRTKEEGMM